MALTPDQALTILANVQQAAPGDIVAACNTIAMEAPNWAKQSLNRDRDLLAKIKELVTSVNALTVAFKAINGGTVPDLGVAPANGTNGATNGTNGAHEVDPNQQVIDFVPSGFKRMKGDGTPMSDEENLVEDMMDAASAGMGDHPAAPQPTQVPGMEVPASVEGVEVEVPIAAAPAATAPAAPRPPRARPQAPAAPKA